MTIAYNICEFFLLSSIYTSSAGSKEMKKILKKFNTFTCTKSICVHARWCHQHCSKIWGIVWHTKRDTCCLSQRLHGLVRVAIISKSMMLISIVIHIAFKLQVLTSEKFWAVAPPSETKRQVFFFSIFVVYSTFPSKRSAYCNTNKVSKRIIIRSANSTRHLKIQRTLRSSSKRYMENQAAWVIEWYPSEYSTTQCFTFS